MGEARAGLVSRALAAVIDVVLLAAAVGGTAAWLRLTSQSLGRFAPPVDLSAAVLACGPLLAFAYHVGFWTAAGQTPGQWVVGIRVQPIGGGRLPFRRALLRFIGCLLSALPLYAGFLWALGPRRLGWHDLLARTEVVYAPAEALRPRRLV